MKRICNLLFVILLSLRIFSQDLQFAHISDTHIGSPNGAAEEDLKRTVDDINKRDYIQFVVLTGDISELGTNDELKLAKQILDQLKIPWYIIPGNHDTGWSESGGEGFINTFGDDKFVFDHSGIRFIGCASGPYVRMSDGHIPRSALVWLDSILRVTPKSQPIIFFNHYPLDPGLDNWYEATDRLEKFNTLAILCGHGHANKRMNFDGIKGFMGRSNLRAKAQVGGYNIVTIRNDSLIYTELRPGTDYSNQWAAVKLKNSNPAGFQKPARPDHSINELYPGVRSRWIYSSNGNIISTPLVTNDLVVFGNQDGLIEGLSLKTGKRKWIIRTGGGIFSSPASHKKNFIIGSTDGAIYCFRADNGKPVWKKQTGAPVLGSPLVQDDIIYIGGSGRHFYALDAHSGNTIWEFTDLSGPVVSTPVRGDGKIIFGAWDRHLYALDKTSGKLAWKWNNGSAIRNYSPASCIPVISEGIVFIVAPDRYISAIDLETGTTLWRNNDATVRESIGISGDGRWIYGKTMQDTVVAYAVSRSKQEAAWKMHCAFGYEHVPSMLIEKDGMVYFGTRNGVVYCIDPSSQKTRWRFKVDNSMVNTVRPIGEGRVIASTMDGKVVLIQGN